MVADQFSIVDVSEQIADRFDPPPSPFRDDPVRWVTDRLGGEVTVRQRMILDALIKYRAVAVPAAHGVGKTAIAARVMAWWVEEYGVNGRIVTTAPSWDQVEGVLWQELRSVADQAEAAGVPLPGVIGQNCVWKIGAREVARGRKPADTKPAGLQGIHASRLLCVVDEADGVAASVIEAMLSLGTGKGAAILFLGNPVDPDSMFAQLCAGHDGGETGWEPGWAGEPGKGGVYVIPYPLILSPLFTGEPVSPALASMLTGQDWLDRIERLFPPGSPSHEGRVMARWPKTATDGVIPGAWLSECMVLERDGTVPTERRVPVELGVDPAYSNGGDMSVIRERRGPLVGRVWRHQVPPEDLARLIVDAIRVTGAERVKVDTTGGAGFLAADLANRRGRGEHNAEVVSVNFAAGAVDSSRFANTRAEMWWTGRELSRDQGWICTEDETTGEGVDRRTMDDLKSARYRTDGAGRIKIEPKDEVRKRLDRSPDDGDALLLAFYTPTQDRATPVSVTRYKQPGRGRW